MATTEEYTHHDLCAFNEQRGKAGELLADYITRTALDIARYDTLTAHNPEHYQRLREAAVTFAVGMVTVFRDRQGKSGVDAVQDAQGILSGIDWSGVGITPVLTPSEHCDMLHALEFHEVDRTC